MPYPRNPHSTPRLVYAYTSGPSSYASGVGVFVPTELRQVDRVISVDIIPPTIADTIVVPRSWDVVSGNAVQVRLNSIATQSGASWSEVANGTNLSGSTIVVTVQGW